MPLSPPVMKTVLPLWFDCVADDMNSYVVLCNRVVKVAPRQKVSSVSRRFFFAYHSVEDSTDT